jgi:RHS repeat-associated protein
MKFTGHERDFFEGGEGDDLDYMHARYCSPFAGRFLSVDPLLRLRPAMTSPQRWNRYAYVAGNPLRWIDSTGMFIQLPCTQSAGCAELGLLQDLLAEAGVDVELSVDENGVVGRVGSDLEDSENDTVALLSGLINDETNGVDFAFTNLDLSDHGGAITTSTPGSNVLVTRINPRQVREGLHTAIALSGPLAGSEVLGTGSVGPSAIHEFGHSAAYFSGFPFDELRTRATSNDWALRYENFHRRLLTGPQNFLRLYHDEK